MFGLSQILLWFLFYIFLSYFFISLSPPAHLFVYSHLVWAVEAHILQVPQLNTILKAVVQEFYHFYATLCFNSTASQMDILYLLPLSLSLSHYKTKTKIFDVSSRIICMRSIYQPFWLVTRPHNPIHHICQYQREYSNNKCVFLLPHP